MIPRAEEPTILKYSTAMPVPISCDVHPHEMAWILVHDHPLAGISDEEGLIVIRDLPVGEVWFRLWHELLITGVAKPRSMDNQRKRKADVSPSKSRLVKILSLIWSSIRIISIAIMCPKLYRRWSVSSSLVD